MAFKPTEPAKDDASTKDANLCEFWMKELSAARKREKNWRTNAAKVIDLYESQKKEESPYNILFSNTETMAPALYNSVPRPVVKRRFDDEDPLGKLSAKAGERMLTFMLDDGLSEGISFDDALRDVVLQALVPGRGVTWIKYTAIIEAEGGEKTEDEKEGRDKSVPERVTFETVELEAVPWDRFLHGYARHWKAVPWVAREHFMTQDEVKKNFGPEWIPHLNFTSLADEDSELTPAQKEELRDAKTALIYEVWDMTSRKVIFLAQSYPKRPLRHIDDPLELSGFFPTPEPLSFYRKLSSLAPSSLYDTYEAQAQELNRVTNRITKVIEALKVRGFYDASIEKLEKLFDETDNTLIPADNVASLEQKGGLEKAIWLFPVEKLVGVLQQLYAQRQQIKAVIFELTGVADIMRGSSQASETLGAQELKNQWGTLRLKRSQKEVARYARDLLRLMLDLAVHKMDDAKIAGMTGMSYPTAAQKQQVQTVIQQLAAAGQQPPPEMQKLLAEPSWDDILKLLRDDLQRSFRIDIETNSTVDAEATEDKANIAELLTAISQFLTGISPLVQSGAMPFDIARGMLLAIVRRFRFGPELEDQLQGMQAPQPQPDPKAEAEKEKLGLEIQIKQGEAQQKQAEMQADATFRAQEHELKMEELRQKGEFSRLQHEQKMAQLQAQTQAAVVQAAVAPAPAPAAKDS